MKLLLFIISLLGFLQTGAYSYKAWTIGNVNAGLGWAIVALVCMLLSNYYGHKIEQKNEDNRY